MLLPWIRIDLPSASTERPPTVNRIEPEQVCEGSCVGHVVEGGEFPVLASEASRNRVRRSAQR